MQARRIASVLGSLLLLPAALQAQSSSASAPVSPAPAAVDTYTYEADGRRDPFLDLMARGAEEIPSVRPEGVAGLATAEVSVRGILQSRGALVAMVQGPDNRTYIVRTGDQLLDGTVKTVVPEGLIIVQKVNDPLSLVKEREVRRLLRSLEGGKE